MNTRFTNALNGVAQNTPPIWLMRQAGRYHSHYQNLRAKHTFVELCKVPKLAAQVALGPIQDFDFDLAILFSDLLFTLEALGLPLSYDEGGPKLGFKLSVENLSKLTAPDKAVSALTFQAEAMSETRKLLDPSKSLIGFVGGPFTLFAYALSCKRHDRCEEAKCNWKLFNAFCGDFLLPLLEEEIELQLKAGAEVVMLLDPSAGVIDPNLFSSDYLPRLKGLVSRFPDRLGYYLRAGSEAHFRALNNLAQPFKGIGIDHRLDLPAILKEKHGGFIQGNFDESLMLLGPEAFKSELERYFAPLLKLSSAERRGWVCGLGHGVLPGTPVENVRNFVKHVRQIFA